MSEAPLHNTLFSEPVPPGAARKRAEESRTWSMLCHLASFAGSTIPFGHIVGPVLVWQIQKNAFPSVDLHGREAVNFQLSLTLYGLLCIPLCFFLIGIPILLGLVVLDVVCTVLAALAAYRGEPYRYPLCLRFV